MTTVLVTGFGPFPGAPSNPTMALARHLGGLRRPAFRDVRRIVRLLPTTWAMLDSIPRLVADVSPDVVLMFGLAGRRRRVTPEARALNHASTLRVDAESRGPTGRVLTSGAPRAMPGTIDAARMVARMRADGLPASVSRDAGDYLCNALFWRVLEQGVPCIFVHVPRPVRATLPNGRLKRPRPAMSTLKRAAERALQEVLMSAPINQATKPRHSRS